MAKQYTNFIPELWSAELNFQLYKSLIASGIVNRDYEGQIRAAGDTVHINRPSGVTVGDYVPGTDITVEKPGSTQLDLVIDQQKYFAFEVDDIERVQANVALIPAYTQEASYALADTLDQYVLGLYTDAHADNVIAAEALTASNIYAKLTQAKANLSKKNVPMQGRWIVLSPDEVALIEASDEFQRASDLGDEVSRNGFMGRAAGFDVYESNNVVEAANVRHLPYGTRAAITMAEQIVETEALRRELQFSDMVRGLHVYGAKVIKPEALGDLRNNIA